MRLTALLLWIAASLSTTGCTSELDADTEQASKVKPLLPPTPAPVVPAEAAPPMPTFAPVADPAVEMPVETGSEALAPAVPADTAGPGAFQILAPSAPILTALDAIAWSAATEAVSYDVTLARDDACTDIVASAMKLTTTQWPAPELSEPRAYFLCVVAHDAAGNPTPATTTFTLATVRHEGWSDVHATGPLVSTRDVELAPAQLRFAWNAMETSLGAPEAYRVYRSTAATVRGEVASAAQAATVISFVDADATPGATYYYTVVAVKSGVELVPKEPHAQIQIVAPPANQALVHRWMANREMCALMQRATDPAQNESCAYSGPASRDGRLDLGHSLLVDMVEAGCDYSPAPACGDAVKGCRGSAAPGAGVGVPGDVYFIDGAATSACQIKTAGNVWTSASHPSNTDPTQRALTDAQAARLITRKPGAPLFTGYFTPADAQAACASRGDRLPSRRESLAASAWASDLSSTQVAEIEAGVAPNGCAGAYTTSDDVTGAASRAACVSRYGIRDLVGNHELNSDQLLCDHTAQTCQGVASAIVPENTDFATLAFGDVLGAAENLGNSYMTGWTLRDDYLTNGLTQFLAPLGLPLRAAAAATYDAMPVTFGGTGGSFDPAKWGAAELLSYAIGSWGAFAESHPRMVTSGNLGRFGLSLRFHVAEVWQTFRCMRPVP